jgi:hypothetical protein
MWMWTLFSPSLLLYCTHPLSYYYDVTWYNMWWNEVRWMTEHCDKALDYSWPSHLNTSPIIPWQLIW